MNYDELKAEIKDEYKPKALYENEKTDELHQTQVIIKEITQKNIMDIDTLAYNLSKRFSFKKKTLASVFCKSSASS